MGTARSNYPDGGLRLCRVVSHRMSTYNTTDCLMTCPRCWKALNHVVDISLGDTSNMVRVGIGERYPFAERRQPQHGGPFEGISENAGYAVCSSCDKDFFCLVEIRSGYLVSVQPNLRIAPYIPDRETQEPCICPECGQSNTRHMEFDQMGLGVFLCNSDGCRFRSQTMLDHSRQIYVGDRVQVLRAI